MTPDPLVPRAPKSGVISYAKPLVTVFLADDDDEFREVARSILTDDGYEVTVAADGREALERLAAMSDADLPLPDVLLLDFVMPKLSGLGVLRALRFVQRLPPTIIMTGFADPSVNAFAASMGAFRLLRKPVTREALCTAVGDAALLATQKNAARRGT
jgi:CheY-like chemotaxis protein